jgi:hypothetical protein
VPLLASGCGGTSEAKPIVEVGPTPPSGTLIETSTKLNSGGGFSNIASAENRTKGTGEALIVGVVAIDRGSPEFQLKVDGRQVPSKTEVFSGGGGSVAAISASRELPLGDSEVSLDARSQGKSQLGVRSLMVFTPAAADDIQPGHLVDSVSASQQHTGIDPTGSGIAALKLRSSVDQVLLLTVYRSPDEGSSSPEAIRTEALLNGTAMNEIGSATMPDGKLAAYYLDQPAGAGDEIDLLGFTVAGRADVHAATLAVCPCGLDPTKP